jgi:hypothetical protein
MKHRGLKTAAPTSFINKAIGLKNIRLYSPGIA